MDLSYRKDLLDWINRSVFKNPFAITLNLKGRLNGIVIDMINCQSALSFFLSRFNRNLLKGRYSRGKERLQVIPTYQVGSFKERQHYHLMIDLPESKSLKDIKAIASSCWSKVDQSYGSPYVKKVYSKGWIEYSTRLKTKKDFIDRNNLYLEAL